MINWGERKKAESVTIRIDNSKKGKRQFGDDTQNALNRKKGSYSNFDVEHTKVRKKRKREKPNTPKGRKAHSD